jgi:hypothetical protein
MAIPVITSVPKKTWQVGLAGFSFTFTGTSDAGSITWSAPALPPGLSLNASTGLLSGTLGGTNGIKTISLSATNTDGVATQAFKVYVSNSGAPYITSSLFLSPVVVGDPFDYQITASNSPTQFDATSLIPGTTMDALGHITGTVGGTAGSKSFTVDAWSGLNVGQSVPISVTIQNPAVADPPVITSASTATGNVGDSFSYTITTDIASSQYQVQFLPDGVTLSDPASPVIDGTPTTAGVYNAVLRARGASGEGWGPEFALEITITDTSGGGGDPECPTGQHWDPVLQTCVDDIIVVPPDVIPAEGVYVEFNPFAEADKDPCPVDTGTTPPVATGAPNPPTNLFLSTPGTPDSGIINVSWTPPAP